MLKNSQKISFVFPCLNEEKGLSIVITEVYQVSSRNDIDFEIILADNGSTDNSIKVAQEVSHKLNIEDKIKIISEPIRGFGAACKAGLNYASGDILILSDCDGSYEYSDENINNLLKKINEGYDMVVGNRFSGKIEKEAMPFLNRYIGNPILSGLTKLLFRIKIKDTQSGLRAIKRDLYKKINIESNEFQFLTEMTIKMHKLGARFTDIDINYRIRKGKTKMTKFSGGLSNIILNLKFFIK